MPNDVKTRLDRLQESKDWLKALSDYRDNPITKMLLEAIENVRLSILDSLLDQEIPGNDNDVKMNFVHERRGQIRGIEEFKRLLNGEITDVEQMVSNLVEEANATRTRTINTSDYTKGGHSEIL